jgi:hypothetical protein
MEISSYEKRGRPSTPFVERLRVSAWSHSVLKANRSMRVTHLEKRLGLEKSPAFPITKGLWSRYLRGEVVPQDAGSTREGTLVNRIERVFPGTRWVFHTPVWEVLEWNTVVDIARMRECYILLGEDCRTSFVAEDGFEGKDGDRRVGKFWHLRKTLPVRRNLLSDFHHWDRLALSLLEAKMAYAAQSYEAFADSQLLACQTIAEMQSFTDSRLKHMHVTYLSMEALCLDAILINVVRPPANGPIQQEIQSQCRNWINDWLVRCESQLNSISRSERFVFASRLREGTQIGASFLQQLEAAEDGKSGHKQFFLAGASSKVAKKIYQETSYVDYLEERENRKRPFK